MVEWKPEMSVDIVRVDEQHRALIDMVHQLYAGVREGAGEEIIRDKFKEFLKFVAAHFSTEEKLMSEHRYPQAALHQREHRKITVFADEFRDMFDEGMVQLSMDILAFLSDRLERHIMNADQRYGRFFKENGIRPMADSRS